jgi:GntR family transcriptional regulator
MQVNKMWIDKKSPIPAYYQLKKILLKQIQEGEFPLGSMIPSERDLSQTYGISRMTVRQALSQLVSDGLLYREKGRGTFVSPVKLEQKNIMSFSNTVRAKGLMPSARVLYFEKEEATEELCERMGLSNGEKVYHLKRLRLADDMPVAVEEDFIPERYCPGLEHWDLKSSLHRMIKNEYGHNVRYVDHVIEATKPNRDEKEMLQITVATPILKLVCEYYTEDDRKIIFEKSIYRSDEYKYNLRVFVSNEEY